MQEFEYKLNTEVGQTVYHVDINIRAESDKHKDTSLYKDGIYVKELKIVYQTKYKIVLSDDFVTVLDRQISGRRKESYHHFLNDISVKIVTKETYWPNGIFAHCITTENPSKAIKKLKMKVVNKINEEYGFLRNMDISSIIDSFEITNEQ